MFSSARVIIKKMILFFTIYIQNIHIPILRRILIYLYTSFSSLHRSNHAKKCLKSQLRKNSGKTFRIHADFIPKPDLGSIVYYFITAHPPCASNARVTGSSSFVYHPTTSRNTSTTTANRHPCQPLQQI